MQSEPTDNMYHTRDTKVHLLHSERVRAAKASTSEVIRAVNSVQLTSVLLRIDAEKHKPAHVCPQDAPTLVRYSKGESAQRWKMIQKEMKAKAKTGTTATSGVHVDHNNNSLLVSSGSVEKGLALEPVPKANLARGEPKDAKSKGAAASPSPAGEGSEEPDPDPLASKKRAKNHGVVNGLSRIAIDLMVDLWFKGVYPETPGANKGPTRKGKAPTKPNSEPEADAEADADAEAEADPAEEKQKAKEKVRENEKDRRREAVLKVLPEDLRDTLRTWSSQALGLPERKLVGDAFILYLDGHFWFNPQAWSFTTGKNGYPICWKALAHAVLWRWNNDYALIPPGLEVSHVTDQALLADPSSFVLETPKENQGRTACRQGRWYEVPHPQFPSGGVTRCPHEVGCREPLEVPISIQIAVAFPGAMQFEVSAGWVPPQGISLPRRETWALGSAKADPGDQRLDHKARSKPEPSGSVSVLMEVDAEVLSNVVQ